MGRNGSRSTPEHISGRLGERVLAIRKQRGFMLREVSERTGVSIAMLSMIERGHSNPSIGTLHALADAFGVRMSDSSSTTTAVGLRRKMPATILMLIPFDTLLPTTKPSAKPNR